MESFARIYSIGSMWYPFAFPHYASAGQTYLYLRRSSCRDTLKDSEKRLGRLATKRCAGLQITLGQVTSANYKISLSERSFCRPARLSYLQSNYRLRSPI